MSTACSMGPDWIVKGQVARHAFLHGPDDLIGIEIDLFILETPLQPFDIHGLEGIR